MFVMFDLKEYTTPHAVTLYTTKRMLGDNSCIGYCLLRDGGHVFKYSLMRCRGELSEVGLDSLCCLKYLQESVLSTFTITALWISQILIYTKKTYADYNFNDFIIDRQIYS